MDENGNLYFQDSNRNFVREKNKLLIFILLIVFLFTGLPVAYAIGITVFAFILVDPEFPMMLAAKVIADSMISYTLLIIPFFVLAAEIMNASSITKRLILFASHLVGRYKGGLAYVNILASIFFATMSGSSIADLSGLGKIKIEAMHNGGFDKPFSAALTASSATMALIIPPSNLFVIYGVLARVSISKLLLAGVMPGLVMGGGFILLVFIMSHLRDYPSTLKPSLKELLDSFKEAFLPLLTPSIIIYGILMGIFTPTEAAIVATAYALFLSVVVYKDLSLINLWHILVSSGVTSAKILLLTSIASLFNVYITTKSLPQNIINSIMQLSTSPFVIILLIVLLVLIIGCFIDNFVSLAFLVPVLTPVATKIGIDPIHFGVIIVIGLMIGLLTPPYGINLFMVIDIAKISFNQYMLAILPFLILMILMLLLITFIPGISTWLPYRFL